MSFHPVPDFYGDFAKVQEKLLELDTAPFANIVETCHGFVVELEYSRESYLARIGSDNAAFKAVPGWVVVAATVDTASYKVSYDYRWVAPPLSDAAPSGVDERAHPRGGRKSRSHSNAL